MKTLNHLTTDKDEKIFYCLKWGENFFKTIKLGNTKLTKIRFFKDMETINSISLVEIEKSYNKFCERNNI